jgi:hypothetical protein
LALDALASDKFEFQLLKLVGPFRVTITQSGAQKFGVEKPVVIGFDVVSPVFDFGTK